MLSPESVATLAENILNGSETVRPDAMFMLIKELAGPEPPDSADHDAIRRYDLAYAVLRIVFPKTSAYQEAFRAAIDSPIESVITDLAA